MKHEKLAGKVVVITGASSGNGRAAALEFARANAKVVLASRNLDLLEDLARTCRELGAEAIAIRTDVTKTMDMERLARTTFETYGRIDVWINNAGVGAVGKLNDVPLEAHLRVLETNLVGPMLGAYAVMPYFRKQNFGTMINSNSVGAYVPLPYATAYSASKYGLRGFMEALRAEVSSEKHIHICEIFPAFLDTPGINHAANFVGKKLRNPYGAGNPERVGRAMVKLAERPHDRAPVMVLTEFARFAYFIAPKLTRFISAKLLGGYFSHAKPTAKNSGTLFHPTNAHHGVRAD